MDTRHSKPVWHTGLFEAGASSKAGRDHSGRNKGSLEPKVDSASRWDDPAPHPSAESSAGPHVSTVRLVLF